MTFKIIFLGEKRQKREQRMIFRYHQISSDMHERDQPKKVRKNSHRGRREPEAKIISQSQ